MNPNEDPMMMMSTSTMPFNRKSLFVQTEEQELIHLRPEQDAEVQTEQVIENPLNRFGGQYREVKERGVDKSTQVKSISVSAEETVFFRQITHIFLLDFSAFPKIQKFSYLTRTLKSSWKNWSEQLLFNVWVKYWKRRK